jgi:hypothetical protein
MTVYPVLCHAFIAGVTALPTDICPGPVTAAFHPKNTSCVQDLRCSASPKSFPDLQHHKAQQPHSSDASKGVSKADQQRAHERHVQCQAPALIWSYSSACHQYYWCTCDGSSMPLTAVSVRSQLVLRGCTRTPERAQNVEWLQTLFCSFLIYGGHLTAQ